MSDDHDDDSDLKECIECGELTPEWEVGYTYCPDCAECLLG